MLKLAVREAATWSENIECEMSVVNVVSVVHSQQPSHY